VPAARFPGLIKSLNHFYELCGQNESEAARRLGVAPAQFHVWRKGTNAPTKTSRREIARVIGISEDALMEGRVEEIAEPYGQARLSRKAQRLIARFEKLLESGDDRLLEHFDGQIDYIERALGVKTTEEEKK